MVKPQFNHSARQLVLEQLKRIWATPIDQLETLERLPMLQRVAVCKKPDSVLTGHKY